MRLLICGSRSIMIDEADVEMAIEEYGLQDITEVISGGAHGPDTAGIMWARKNKIPCKIVRPEWKKYGKKAGILRNKEMVKMCDVCVAFWDGDSVGTASTIGFAEEEGIPVYVKEMRD